MLIASHDLQLVQKFGSRRIVLSGGQVSSSDTVDRAAGAGT
jgi:ABC-type polysaccharide/polyol phosphate transport system ATPase subunit